MICLSLYSWYESMSGFKARQSGSRATGAPLLALEVVMEIKVWLVYL